MNVTGNPRSRLVHPKQVMVGSNKEPVPLCTVQIGGRTSTIWLANPPDGSPSLPLSARRAKLAELIRQNESDGIDPESIAAWKQVLQALDEYIALHGDVFSGDLSAPATHPDTDARR